MKQLLEIKMKKEAYLMAHSLMNAMDKYSHDMSWEAKRELELYAKLSSRVPLPSGRWGNAIALALEINDYVSAGFLITCGEELNLDIENVVDDADGSLRSEYLYSELTFQPDELTRDDFKNEDVYNKYKEFYTRNIVAQRGIERMLNILEEDKKAYRK